MPNGRQIKLLKTLLTSVCERNCFYCPFRAGRDFRRATFQPDEMAQTFMAVTHANAAEGIFLSSGIVRGGLSSQDKLIDTADILRNSTPWLHHENHARVERPGSSGRSRKPCVNQPEAPNTARLESYTRQFLADYYRHMVQKSGAPSQPKAE
jgi:predicted DNA-binding helix-hairpin-helix protein